MDATTNAIMIDLMTSGPFRVTEPDTSFSSKIRYVYVHIWSYMFLFEIFLRMARWVLVNETKIQSIKHCEPSNTWKWDGLRLCRITRVMTSGSPPHHDCSSSGFKGSDFGGFCPLGYRPSLLTNLRLSYWARPSQITMESVPHWPVCTCISNNDWVHSLAKWSRASDSPLPCPVNTYNPHLDFSIRPPPLQTNHSFHHSNWQVYEIFSNVAFSYPRTETRCFVSVIWVPSPPQHAAACRVLEVRCRVSKSISHSFLFCLEQNINALIFTENRRYKL